MSLTYACARCIYPDSKVLCAQIRGLQYSYHCDVVAFQGRLQYREPNNNMILAFQA
jgi:hypothetical protein